MHPPSDATFSIAPVLPLSDSIVANLVSFGHRVQPNPNTVFGFAECLFCTILFHCYSFFPGRTCQIAGMLIIMSAVCAQPASAE